MSNLVYSGYEWLGNIPDDWNLERLSWHMTEIKESNNPIKSTNVLSLTNKLGVVPYEEKGNQGNVAKEDYSQYKLAYPNTIIANSMNVLIGSVGKCNYFGCVSPVYYVFKPNDGENIDFLNYIFQLQPFQKELRRYANGILEIRLRVSASNILKREVALPSISQQVKIVNYLNRKCSQIDELIAIQEQEIEKLQAYKHSLITEVVTKGLDPNVEMKDSGVEWIGITPKHWEVKQLRYIANDFQKGSGITKEDIINDGDINCVRYADLYTDYSYNFKDCKIKTNLALHTSPKYFSYGDLLFTCTGELVEEIGKSASYLGHEKCLAGGDIIICRHSQNPTFMGYALGSLYCQMQKSYGKRKLKVVHISLSEIKNIFVTLPSLEEQNQIGEFLNQKCLHIDELIELKNNKIDQLHNYKKSLIYEYVTGKKEV